ncbi:FKBP-type peptidyl-prolyl cis-trans isomerase [bacterium CPR1]|nr:FKBP-type peptidyl-prolyl cis-trans isomerase [bacterium CPR1]
MKRTLLALSLGLLTLGCGQPPSTGETTGASTPRTPATTAPADASPSPSDVAASPGDEASPAASSSPDASPSPDPSPGETSKHDPSKPVPPKKGETGKKKTESGLSYTVLIEGTDKGTAAAGDMVSAHYTGWLTDGTPFDSSLTRGEPIKFPLGQGNVIPGWDEGLQGMKVGETRRLYIPSKLAYGEQGTPGGPIPPNADLVFEVTLVELPGKK